MRSFKTLELIIRPKEESIVDIFGIKISILQFPGVKPWYINMSIGEPRVFTLQTTLSFEPSHFLFVKTKDSLDIYCNGELISSMSNREALKKLFVDFDTFLNPHYLSYKNIITIRAYQSILSEKEIRSCYMSFRAMKFYTPVIISDPCTLIGKVDERAPTMTISCQASNNSKDWVDLTNVPSLTRAEKLIKEYESKLLQPDLTKQVAELLMYDMAWKTWQRTRQNKKNFNLSKEHVKFDKWYASKLSLTESL